MFERNRSMVKVGGGKGAMTLAGEQPTYPWLKEGRVLGEEVAEAPGSSAEI